MFILNKIKSLLPTRPFAESGELTPEEFEKAGDQITLFGWKWMPAVEQARNNAKLPNPKKQYLIGEGVSYQRVAQLVKNVETHCKGVVDKNGLFVIDEVISSEQHSEEGQRKYQLLITYDCDYRTPRMWLRGFRVLQGLPLSQQELFEDIYTQYQGRTITLELNPQTGTNMLTVHPCNHASALKNLMGSRQEIIHVVLVVFVKFIASVMPTLRFDCSLDVDM